MTYFNINHSLHTTGNDFSVYNDNFQILIFRFWFKFLSTLSNFKLKLSEPKLLYPQILWIWACQLENIQLKSYPIRAILLSRQRRIIIHYKWLLQDRSYATPWYKQSIVLKLSFEISEFSCVFLAKNHKNTNPRMCASRAWIKNFLKFSPLNFQSSYIHVWYKYKEHEKQRTATTVDISLY